jgi:hypothetical protein
MLIRIAMTGGLKTLARVAERGPLTRIVEGVTGGGKKNYLTSIHIYIIFFIFFLYDGNYLRERATFFHANRVKRFEPNSMDSNSCIFLFAGRLHTHGQQSLPQ